MPKNQAEITINIKIPTENESEKVTDDLPSKAFLKNLIKSKKVVILSPHLDDGVLSAGSLICHLLSNNVGVAVISFFTEGSEATSSSIKTIMNRANFTDAKKYFLARRMEDKVALGVLGKKITFQHLGFTDAAWRIGDGGLQLYPDTQLTEISQKDDLLIGTIEEKMKAVVNPSEDVLVFAPLARGKHVDHQIIRNIATKLFSQVVFYEDFPYSTLYGDEDEFIKENKLKGSQWQGDYLLKKKAILKYETQKVSLFFRGTMHLPFEKYFASEKLS